MKTGYPIIDADGHVLEKDTELHDFLEGRYRGMPRMETYGYQMSVLYPTGGLALGLSQDHEWACALARAYNSWIYEKFTRGNPRLKAVALLPVQEPAEAARELKRAKEMGLVAGLLPAVTVLHKGYGHQDFDPIFREAERLDMPLAIHGAPSRGMGFDYFDKFIQVHTLEHPFAILIQFTHMIFEGLFERFPRLRVAFLEAGSGWLPYMMDRMDEEFEKLYPLGPGLDDVRSRRKGADTGAPAVQPALRHVAVGLSARAPARDVQARYPRIPRANRPERPGKAADPLRQSQGVLPAGDLTNRISCSWLVFVERARKPSTSTAWS
ncbi:MAG: amidohydrolase family protein [Deltaproteobacteria bacterium]|nr:amidohydrolase family protein [Deltaproteobacteria bacterium]